MLRLPHSLLLLLGSTAASVVTDAPLNFTSLIADDESATCIANSSSCAGTWWSSRDEKRSFYVTAGPVAAAWAFFVGACNGHAGTYPTHSLRTGPNVTVYGARHPLGAQVRVTVDANSTLVDTSGEDFQWGALFQQDWLDPTANHTLTLEYVPSSDWHNAMLDGHSQTIYIESAVLQQTGDANAPTTMYAAQSIAPA